VLRIAVPNKGSLSDPAITMLSEAGYRTRRTGRELVLVDEANDVELFFLRPRDIAVYVGQGTVHAGMTGRDLLLDSLLLDLEELTLLGRLADRIEVDREWREPLLALLGCLTQSPETLSRLQGHPASRNLLLDAADVLAGTAIPDPAPVGRPEALQYALAAGGIEPEEEEGEEIEPRPPSGPGGAPAVNDARHLTAQAAAARELLDLARDPDFPVNWPVRPSVAEQVHACTGTEPGRRSSVRWP